MFHLISNRNERTALPVTQSFIRLQNKRLPWLCIHQKLVPISKCIDIEPISPKSFDSRKFIQYSLVATIRTRKEETFNACQNRMLMCSNEKTEHRFATSTQKHRIVTIPHSHTFSTLTSRVDRSHKHTRIHSHPSSASKAKFPDIRIFSSSVDFFIDFVHMIFLVVYPYNWTVVHESKAFLAQSKEVSVISSGLPRSKDLLKILQ